MTDKISASPDVVRGTIVDYWDHISEHEIDKSWRDYQTPEYWDYRRKFESAQKREYVGPFPLSIEIEATYYCNLECPFCPRVVSIGEREDKHMDPGLWDKIVKEIAENSLPALFMDHEAESMMNPKFFDMVKQASDARIMDISMHTNANLLTPARSEKLIDNGLTKINFSIDAAEEEAYKVLRVGGNFQKVLKNVTAFLEAKLARDAGYLRTRVSFVEQKANAHQKRAFFDFWSKHKGLNVVTFQECMNFPIFNEPDADESLTDQQLDAKYQNSDPFHCSLPWEQPVIDVDGNVVPCGVPIREKNKDFVLGNLQNGDTIKTCWTSPKMQKLRDQHQKGEWYKNRVCRVCVKSMRQSRPTAQSL